MDDVRRMDVSTFALGAAVLWGVLIGIAVIVAARVRSRGTADAGGADRRASPVGLWDLAVGAFVGGVGLGLSMFVCNRLLRMTSFGAISLTYLFGVVAAPLAMAVVLGGAWWGRRRTSAAIAAPVVTRPALAVCVAGLLLAPLGFYATHIEPELLDVERPSPLAVAPERSGSSSITVGVLTDLQTTAVGDHERRAVDELMAARPDVIVLPGDVFQADDESFTRNLPALHELLGRLAAPGGVYLVGGDVDQPLDRLRRLAEGTAIRYLADEVVTTRVADRTVTIGGIGLDYDSPAALAVVEQLETAPGDEDIRILLAHRPDPVLTLRRDSRIDLQVSGHTHGGQVSVPFVGPLMTLTGVPRWVAAGGLHELDGHPIYVGRGVGLEHGQAPQVRFLVRPNIGVLTLEG